MPVEKIAYLGFENCYRVTNGTVEVIVTTDIGPRIIRYGFPGGENILGEVPDVAVATPLGEWKPWGGHRLWTAPEAMPRSYAPDNDSIESEIDGDLHIRLKQPVEQGTGIGKEMEISLASQGSCVTIEHTITNHNLWEIELAPWALTIMNGGGVTILPQEPQRSHGGDNLLPARTMALWYYTDLSDPRWTIGRRFIRLRSDATLHHPQKIGILNRQGWGAYHRADTLFIKRFPFLEEEIYPDMGCNTESYTAGLFMELESLAPLQVLGPGESAHHPERWYLFGDVTIGESEETIEETLTPLLAETLGW